MGTVDVGSVVDLPGRESGAGAGLHVHVSARVEDLLTPLVERLRDHAPADPFAMVPIVVQSRGMERWLSHQLAQRLDPGGWGICAGVAFPFPGQVIRWLLEATERDADPGTPAGAAGLAWEPQRLTWTVLEALRDLRGHPELAALDRYLAAGTPGGADPDVVDRRAWQLARGVADVFDRYALHRPELARAWSGVANAPAAPEARHPWQPLLWREVVARIGVPTDRLDRAIERLSDPGGTLSAQGLPAPLSFFGISTLPPRHLDALAALATRVAVHLYVPTPSVARWEAARVTGRGAEVAPPAHPLLRSCGRLGDDAAVLLTARLGEKGSLGFPDQEPEDAAPRGLLDALQRSLRDDRLPDEPHVVDVGDKGGDRSVQIHLCHGPARQAEVLRDVLLRLMADDSALQPRDVLVMTPDVATHAPLVQAAFAADGAGASRVPVRVADRQLGQTNPVADVLLAVLDLAAGRVTASQVLDVLSRPSVARRFGLSDDLELIGSWVADLGIRWGIDADHRARRGQPAERIHTWRLGLDRLLLGVAMADQDDRVLGDVVPFDHVEGDVVAVAGRLAEACAVLFGAVEDVQDPRDASAWATTLAALLEDVCQVEPTERWLVHEVLTALEGLADAGGVSEQDGTGQAPPAVLDLSAIRQALAGAVGVPRGAAGYETGAVTVCAVVPMRSIPHKVVCLLGMDDGAFPRPAPALGFDLSADTHQLGDSDRRGEDRFLFLEAVMSAREHLVVTATGRDVRTDAVRAPAVPVVDLREALDRVARTASGTSVSDEVTTTHPLQAFSPRNFGVDAAGQPTQPMSFDHALQDGARALARGTHQERVFLSAALRPVADAAEPVALDQLIASIVNPTRFLLSTRLGLYLAEDVLQIRDGEPLALDGLERYALGEDLVRVGEAGMRDAWMRARLASGAVPAGTPGTQEMQAIIEEVTDLTALAETELAARLGRQTAIHPTDLRRSDVDVVLGGRRITGSLGGVGADASGRVTHRVDIAFVRPKDERELRLWIAHLALLASGHGAAQTLAVWRGKSSGSPKPTVRWLSPLDADADRSTRLAAGHLTTLLGVHDRAGRELVPLFASASRCIAAKGWDTARRAFRADDDNGYGQDADEATDMAYGPEAQLDDVLGDDVARADFVATARAVWDPFLAALKDGGR